MTTTADVMDDMMARTVAMVREVTAGTEMTEAQFTEAVTRTFAAMVSAMMEEMTAAGRSDIAARMAHFMATTAHEGA